jgi:hypothetical protein
MDFFHGRQFTTASIHKLSGIPFRKTGSKLHAIAVIFKHMGLNPAPVLSFTAWAN